MTDEDTESLLSLRDMCAAASTRPVSPSTASPVTVSAPTASPVTVSAPTSSPVSVSAPTSCSAQKESGPANIFDLNNLLLLALQIEDQMKYNESEFLE